MRFTCGVIVLFIAFNDDYVAQAIALDFIFKVHILLGCHGLYLLYLLLYIEQLGLVLRIQTYLLVGVLLVEHLVLFSSD